MASIAVRYALFGGVAVCGNLGTQAIVASQVPGDPLVASIVCGTGAGFVIKYILDKRWIFRDPVERRGREIRKIALYGLFSVLTTLIFSGGETIAWLCWRTDTAKYLGAALGLLIGYVIKYVLDRQITFRTATSSRRSTARGE